MRLPITNIQKPHGASTPIKSALYRARGEPQRELSTRERKKKIIEIDISVKQRQIDN